MHELLFLLAAYEQRHATPSTKCVQLSLKCTLSMLRNTVRCFSSLVLPFSIPNVWMFRYLVCTLKNSSYDNILLFHLLHAIKFEIIISMILIPLETMRAVSIQSLSMSLHVSLSLCPLLRPTCSHYSPARKKRH